jgi:hypothetical protein
VSNISVFFHLIWITFSIHRATLFENDEYSIDRLDWRLYMYTHLLLKWDWSTFWSYIHQSLNSKPGIFDIPCAYEKLTCQSFVYFVWKSILCLCIWNSYAWIPLLHQCSFIYLAINREKTYL